jgi:hypothetical protein
MLPLVMLYVGGGVGGTPQPIVATQPNSRTELSEKNWNVIHPFALTTNPGLFAEKVPIGVAAMLLPANTDKKSKPSSRLKLVKFK